ncbi:MAG: hypothetical protein ACOYOU_06120 [Kiritimatiellia bacterium]
MRLELTSFLRGLLTDFRWKIAALVMAVVVFYAVRSKISDTVTLSVPVETEKEPGLAVLKAEPFSVRVTFRGAYADLQQLGLRELRVLLRPKSSDSEGTELVRIRAGNVRGQPGGARVVGVSPESVMLTFDRQDQMMLPVAPPPVEGKPLRGRVELDYFPRQVLVKGAHRQLLEWKAADFHLQTQPINVEGCVQSFTKSVDIATPGAAWQAEVTPREVSVKVNILTEQSTRELREVPVLIAAHAGRKGFWQVLPASVVVRLTGRVEVVESVTPESLMVLVDARRAPAEELSIAPVVVQLPPGVILDAVECEPSAVVLLRTEDAP